MVHRRLLFVHAHPDDESIETGATMARYAAEGAHVTLVTCTLGEEGEVCVPELRHLSGEALGAHRVGELEAACRALGVTDQKFLGGPGRYRDSGMMGVASNDHPASFWRADLEEATGLLLDIMRDVRPQVVVSYDENGFYGHPDHIQAHRVAWRAFRRFEEARKFYYTAAPRSELESALHAVQTGDHPFHALDSVDELPFGVSDDSVSTEIPATDYLDAKLKAMAAHATQIYLHPPFYALSNEIGLTVPGTEYFVLAAGPRGAGSGPHGRERDLFAGLDDD